MHFVDVIRHDCLHVAKRLRSRTGLFVHCGEGGGGLPDVRPGEIRQLLVQILQLRRNLFETGGVEEVLAEDLIADAWAGYAHERFREVAETLRVDIANILNERLVVGAAALGDVRKLRLKPVHRIHMAINPGKRLAEPDGRASKRREPAKGEPSLRRERREVRANGSGVVAYRCDAFRKEGDVSLGDLPESSLHE